MTSPAYYQSQQHTAHENSYSAAQVELIVSGIKAEWDERTQWIADTSFLEWEDPTFRHTPGLRPFTLPATTLNCQWWGMPWIDALASQKQTSALPAELLVNGHSYFKGHLELLRWEKRETEGRGRFVVQLVPAEQALLQQLDKLPLHLLPMPELVHTYSRSHIVASWTNPSSAYCYPLINYGLLAQHTQDTELALRDFYPAVRVPYILQQLARHLGLRLDAEVLQHPALSLLAIPYTGPAFAHSAVWRVAREVTMRRDSIFASTPAGEIVPWIDVSQGMLSSWNTSTHTYHADQHYPVKIRLQGTLSGIAASFWLRVNGVDQQQQFVYPGPFSLEWDLTMEAGDSWQLLFVGNGELLLDAQMDIVPEVLYEESSTIEPATLLPYGLTATDFLRLIYRAFHLQLSIDLSTRTLRLHALSALATQAGSRLSSMPLVQDDARSEPLTRQSTRWQYAALCLPESHFLALDATLGSENDLNRRGSPDPNIQLQTLPVHFSVMQLAFQGGMSLLYLPLARLEGDPTEFVWDASLPMTWCWVGPKSATGGMAVNAWSNPSSPLDYIRFDGANHSSVPLAWTWLPAHLQPSGSLPSSLPSGLGFGNMPAGARPTLLEVFHDPWRTYIGQRWRMQQWRRIPAAMGKPAWHSLWHDDTPPHCNDENGLSRLLAIRNWNLRDQIGEVELWR